jgi:hypothetical protein
MQVDKETDLAVLNSYILFFSCGGKKPSPRDFQITLLENMLAQTGEDRNVQRPTGGTAAAATPVVRLEELGRKYWPTPSATQR